MPADLVDELVDVADKRVKVLQDDDSADGDADEDQPASQASDASSIAEPDRLEKDEIRHRVLMALEKDFPFRPLSQLKLSSHLQKEVGRFQKWIPSISVAGRNFQAPFPLPPLPPPPPGPLHSRRLSRHPLFDRLVLSCPLLPQQLLPRPAHHATQRVLRSTISPPHLRHLPPHHRARRSPER
ncbi:unnamed protein product [Vitrella brassicaformis CCMP3155]|uniref:Uncharacterized protein n=1 Tax=Vitrella brassicaformis (strain CCMP3155) TaxID=1169540 RepID=A0A0G4G7J4_VITBC|nr:unnamed protein product [Vitrella brassicaformis CCMP3155]|eukprot:CEM24606.1 unnamed protein product [Vitrella brassicaformis CCMP3155]